MTVSRVINGEKRVRDETRERVEQCVASLNYLPSSAARALAGGEEIRIGLLHANPSFAYLSEFLVGSLDQASRSNVQLIIEKCDDDGQDLKAVEHLIKARVDGFILPPPLSDAEAILEKIHRHGLPAVAVATGRAPDWALSVSIDDRQAAYDMTRHLGALGHERIGFITGNANQAASAERLHGYLTALGDMELERDRTLIVDGLFTYRSGLDAAEKLLDASGPPTAIFASNDDMAAAVVAIAHRRGLDVPRDLTVCGFDDTAMATTIWPELTTIRQPVFDMSRRAVELLVQEIRRRNAGALLAQEPHAVIGYELIRRQSDGPPARSRKSGVNDDGEVGGDTVPVLGIAVS
jgi:LacI family transcriptional regulator